MIRISADAVELEYTWDGTSIVGPPPLATQLQLSLWREGQAPWQVQPDPDETWLGVEPVNGVAEHISFSTAERLRLPWRLHGLPAGLVATSSQVIEDPAYQPWSAELAFVNPRWPSQVALVVRSDRFGYELHDDFQPQSHVHGLPATVTAEVSGATLIARDAGVTHSLYVAAPEPLGSLGPGGVAGLFARFDLLGEPAEWTDHPLD